MPRSIVDSGESGRHKNKRESRRYHPQIFHRQLRHVAFHPEYPYQRNGTRQD